MLSWLLWKRRIMKTVDMTRLRRILINGMMYPCHGLAIPPQKGSREDIAGHPLLMPKPMMATPALL
jgi:hypothetical protein